MKPRHAFVIVFVIASALMVGPHSAVAVLLLVGLPVLWLGGGMDKLGGAARRRVSP